jgi:CheY-specific phosphatase CheX
MLYSRSTTVRALVRVHDLTSFTDDAQLSTVEHLGAMLSQSIAHALTDAGAAMTTTTPIVIATSETCVKDDNRTPSLKRTVYDLHGCLQQVAFL